jgi:hypothetical protein
MMKNSTTPAIMRTICLNISAGAEVATTERPRVVRKEGQYLHLKAVAAHAAHGKITEPLDEDQREKAEDDAGGVVRRGGDGVLQQQKRLEHGEPEEREPRAHVAPRGRPSGLQLGALGGGNVLKHQLLAGELYRVAGADRRAVSGGVFAVYPGAAPGEGVVQLPHAVVAAYEDAVHPADRLVLKGYVGRAGPAQKVFPVVQRVYLVAAAVQHVSPDLGLVFFTQHGAQAPENDPQRQHGQYISGRGNDVCHHRIQPHPPP